MKNFFLIIKVAVLIFFVFSCAGNSTVEIKNSYDYKSTSSYDWKVSSPEKQGLNSDMIARAVEKVSEKAYYKSFLIIRNGYLVLEKYHSDNNKYTMDLVYSVTKSYVSALIGIAIHQGYIESVNSKVLDFFPHYFNNNIDARKLDITVGHLLTMSSGFDQEENLNKKANNARNMIESIIASDLQFDPGTDFLYSTHSTHLLSGIIHKVTGKTTLQYLYSELLKPAGIKSIIWTKDQNGIYFGGAGMFLAPRDMARFGYLYLNGGRLEGKQIIPEEWINQSVINHRQYTEEWNEMKEVGYGYLWWTGKLKGYPVYFASGFGGQWILVIPDLDMIIVSTMFAFTEKKWEQMASLITVVNDYIIPAVNK